MLKTPAYLRNLVLAILVAATTPLQAMADGEISGYRIHLYGI